MASTASISRVAVFNKYRLTWVDDWMNCSLELLFSGHGSPGNQKPRSKKLMSWRKRKRTSLASVLVSVVGWTLSLSPATKKRERERGREAHLEPQEPSKMRDSYPQCTVIRLLTLLNSQPQIRWGASLTQPWWWGQGSQTIKSRIPEKHCSSLHSSYHGKLKVCSLRLTLSISLVGWSEQSGVHYYPGSLA